MPPPVRAFQRAEPRARLPELLVPEWVATHRTQPAARRPCATEALPGAVLPCTLAWVGPERLPTLRALAHPRRPPVPGGEVARLGAELPIRIARLQRERLRALRACSMDAPAGSAMLAGPRAEAPTSAHDPRGDDPEHETAHRARTRHAPRSAPRAALDGAEAPNPRPRPEQLLASALLTDQTGRGLAERVATAIRRAKPGLSSTAGRLEWLAALRARQGRRPVVLPGGGEPAVLPAELRLAEVANPGRLDREGLAAPSTGPLDGRTAPHVSAPAGAVPILSGAQRGPTSRARALDRHRAIIAQSVKFR